MNLIQLCRASKRAVSLALGSIISVIGFAGVAHAQGAAEAAYPSKPIRLIVPFATGSSTDIAARRLEHHMSRTLGQQIIIDNRAGALGVIGGELLKRSAPDGYTLMLTAVPTFQSALRPKTMPYDVIKDFTPIGRAFTTTNFIVVHPNVPAHSLRELVAYSKTLPNGLSFASGGTGSTGHIVGEMLRLSGAKMVHVPYTAVSQGITDVLGGHLPVMIYTVALLPHVKSGRLKALAAASEKRHFLATDIPTVVEEGFPDAVIQGWTGLYGPAGLPNAIRDRVYAALRGALEDPEVKKAYQEAGLEEGLMKPDEFRAFIDKDLAMWKDIVFRVKLPTDADR